MKKTAVFLVIQDEKTTYHPLVTIFLKQCYETLIDVAQESPGGKLPYKTNFILDEFANMPPLKDVTTMVTAARSRNIRFTFIIQNFAQLNEVYGKDQAETIKGNCGNIIYLISSEMSALEEISKMCGEVKSKEKDKTASTPLVTVSDLQRLPQWSVIVLRIRMMPFKAKLTPYFKMAQQGLWGKKYDLAPYPVREKHDFSVFDIKGFVDKKRQEKMNEIFGGSSSPSGMPSGGGMPIGNIFGNQSRETKPTPPPFPMPGMGDGGDLNIDDVLKKIDAKIAELEEEERQEKAKLESELQGSKEKETSVVEETPVIEEKSIPAEEPVSEEATVEEKEVIEEKPILEEEPAIDEVSEPDDDFNDNIVDDEFEFPVERGMLPNIPSVPIVEPIESEPVTEVVEDSVDTDDEEDIQSILNNMDEETKKELLAQVDSKIQELEQNEQVKSVVMEEPEKEEVVKTTPAIVEDIVSLDDDFITDDQFFDDFFSEEEE